MKDYLKIAAVVLLLLALLSIEPIIKWKNYAECRAHNFSKFFCLTH